MAASSSKTENLSKSLWASVDERLANRNFEDGKDFAAAEKSKRQREYRWIVDAILPLMLSIIAGIGVLLPIELSTQARISLFFFAVAAILWAMTELNAAYVALTVTILLIFTGGRPQEAFFEALASDVIWLMIGAFILGEAVRTTDLAVRLTNLVVKRARNVSQIFWLMSVVAVVLSFFIPSTSGRAAVTYPIFRSISEKIGEDKVTKALAILLPTIILVSTICSLVGAGSHLIANDLLSKISGKSISFLQWIIYGLPFGVMASAASCFVILRMFLGKDKRKIKLSLKESIAEKKFSKAEKKTLIIILAMVIFWVTEHWHGFEIATVTIGGAVLLTMPRFGIMDWKTGLKSVSWNLIIFVGAALVLGNALIETGAAEWIIKNLFSLTGLNQTTGNNGILMLLTVAFISLTSHIYMTSHSARAAALVPPLLYLATSLEISPVAMLFISTVGMDYCLTFPVSSKAILLYQEAGDGETFDPADLLKLSSVLIIVHLFLMIAFYYFYWKWVGLSF
ncbi:SLC13 family permease [soil metagenome]